MGQPEVMITCDECARSGNTHTAFMNSDIELTYLHQVTLLVWS
jgi:hypothetical protein